VHKLFLEHAERRCLLKVLKSVRSVATMLLRVENVIPIKS